MKKLLLFVFAFLAINASAKVLTVNNALNGGAQFVEIQEAIDAAGHGDTIFVHGSPTVYKSFLLLNKKIAFFGPGWAPDKNNAVRALVDFGVIRNNTASNVAATSSGSVVHGLVFNRGLTFGQGIINDVGVNNIRIDRCEFRSRVEIGLTASNYIVENCYFTGSVAGFGFNAQASYSNLLFHNNTFRIDNSNNGCFTGLANSSAVLLDHNLFYTNAAGANGSPIFVNTVTRFLTLTNNVFVNMNVGNSLEKSTFNNNITFYSGIAPNPAPWTIGENIDGGGNVNATDPKLTAQVEINKGTDNPLLDFTVAAGPANNSGSDGKDMGLLFDATGSLNWASARGARLPYIFSMNITNPTVAPGGNLNVEVTAKKNN